MEMQMLAFFTVEANQPGAKHFRLDVGCPLYPSFIAIVLMVSRLI